MTIFVFVGSLLALMALGMPVAFALIGCGLSMMFYLGVTDPQIVIQNMWDGANSFPLLAVPFFMLAGEFMNAGGMTRRIIMMASPIITPGTMPAIKSLVIDTPPVTPNRIMPIDGGITGAMMPPQAIRPQERFTS